MTDVNSYAPGTLCWVDVTCDDTAAGVAFYTELFGWTAVSDGGDFTTFTLGGRTVAGLGPCQPGTRPSWNVYVAVEDVDATVATAQAAGGRLVAGPVDIHEAGRAAAVADPRGGVFTLWQAREHIGARAYQIPGTWYWSDLVTDDIPRSVGFYSTLFGWAVRGTDPTGSTGAVALLDDRPVAGFSPMPPGATVTPYWSVTFQVEDIAESAAKAAKLGGSITVEPRAVPNVGQFALITAPDGETLSLLQPAE